MMFLVGCLLGFIIPQAICWTGREWADRRGISGMAWITLSHLVGIAIAMGLIVLIAAVAK